MKKILVLILTIVSLSASAQKITTSFFDCTFGEASNLVYQTLKDAKLEPIAGDDCIYLQNKDVYGITFKTIGLKFTNDDTFYNVFAYNKYEAKKEAEKAFDENVSKIREDYPNIQQMNKVDGCLKMYAYADRETDEAFSIGLYKNNAGVYFVRINILSNYLLKRSKANN